MLSRLLRSSSCHSRGHNHRGLATTRLSGNPVHRGIHHSSVVRYYSGLPNSIFALKSLEWRRILSRSDSRTMGICWLSTVSEGTQCRSTLDGNCSMTKAKMLIEENSDDVDGHTEAEKQCRLQKLLEARELLRICTACAQKAEAAFQLGSFLLHFPNLEMSGIKKPPGSQTDVLKEINVIKVNNRRRRKEMRSRDGGVSLATNDSEEAPEILSASELENRTDEEQAVYYLRCAAHQGHGKAMCLLANTLMKSDRATVVSEGIRWYQRAVELKPPVVDALYNLGVIYFEGNELGQVKPDPSAAFKYFTTAANAGDADAHYWLGHVHSSADTPWLDPQKAIKHFCLAGECGHKNALYRLAMLYRDGASAKSREQCLTGMQDFVDHAGCSGDHDDFQNAHNNCDHENHKCTEVSEFPLQEAAEGVSGDLSPCPDQFLVYLHRAIHEDNDPYAIAELAEIKLLGLHNIPADEVHAYQLFTVAHSMGHAHASYCLGAMHYRGQANIPRDPQKAFEFYNIAAEGGSLDAWRCLASMYYLGDGVTRCESTAREIMKTIAKMV
jgi:TPR repeat protein